MYGLFDIAELGQTTLQGGKVTGSPELNEGVDLIESYRKVLVTSGELR